MNILLTNDDSHHAAGINTLFRAFVEHYGEEHVFMVAPEREQSACSHALTLHKALRVHEHGKNRYSVSGTPADCVSIALSTLLDRPIDLVVSGINHGQNLGTDIANSGTVSGAMQAALLGKQAIAVSAHYKSRAGEKPNFAVAAEVAYLWARKLEKRPLPLYSLLNINVPANVELQQLNAATPPWRITNMGVRRYEQHFERRQDPRGRDYFWNASRDQGGLPNGNSDSEAVAAGFIAITPIQLDYTNHTLYEQLRSW